MKKIIKILLVDDHPMVRTGLRLMMEQQKLFDPIITEADNGETALKEILTGKYNIIFLDISLPKMDGISVIKQAVDKGNKTPILVITMHNEEHIVKQVVDGKAMYYVDCVAE